MRHFRTPPLRRLNSASYAITGLPDIAEIAARYIFAEEPSIFAF